MGTDTSLRISTPTIEVARPAGIRLRAVLLAIPIIVADSYWVVMMERVLRGPFPTIISLFANAVFILAVLILLNSLLKKISPRNALTAAEMLVVYTMTAIGASFAGLDLGPTLIMMMSHPYQFATPENKWATEVIPYLPKSLTVGDPAALKPFYEGGSSLYEQGHWLVWLGPCLRWLVFLSVLFFVMMCINTLVRKQWSDRERLTFPIIQLPVAMTEPKGALWRSKLFWLGFFISFAIDLVNGLAVYYPNIPTIVVGLSPTHNLALSFVSPPWDAIGWTPYTFYPFVIGLGYFLPVDLSFSCWFFYIFWKLQLVAARALAMDAVSEFPYIRHQAFGGFVAILFTLTWTARGYLKQVWLRIIGRKSELDDSHEPMSYRSAAVGALVGFLFVAGFMRQMGMSPLIALLAFVIYFVLAVSIARVRAELGPPVHDMHFSGPDYMIPTCFGIGGLTRGDLLGLTYTYWFNRAYRGHPMPIGIEGMRMAQLTRSDQKHWYRAMMIAAVIGGAAAFWAFLHLGYEFGLAAKVRGGTGFAREAFNNLSHWLTRPRDLITPNWGANTAVLVGFGTSLLLGWARLQGGYFPFHPIGYAISGNWSMNLVWLPILIAWLIKATILKYGGLRLYKRAIPFFLGLILGQMIIGCLWALIGISFWIPFYSFWGA